MPQAVALREEGAAARGLFSARFNAVLGGELRFKGTAAMTGSEAILCSKLLRREVACVSGASRGRPAGCWWVGGGDSSSSFSLEEELLS